MTATVVTNASSKPVEKVLKHIDVNLEACTSEDCSERFSVTGKKDAKK